MLVQLHNQLVETSFVYKVGEVRIDNDAVFFKIEYLNRNHVAIEFLYDDFYRKELLNDLFDYKKGFDDFKGIIQIPVVKKDHELVLKLKELAEGYRNAFIEMVNNQKPVVVIKPKKL